VLLSESCNIPLAKVAKAGVKALTLGRLVGADQGYFRAECIGHASALLGCGSAGGTSGSQRDDSFGVS
jgi:hypothetical protein